MRSDARLAIPSPTGSQIALTDGSMSELWVVDVLGQQPRRVLQHSANTTFKPLSWMPNGRSLLVQRLEYGARFPAPSWDPLRGVRATYLAINVADGRIQSDKDLMWMEDAAMLSGNELLYTHNDGASLMLWSVALDPETGAFRSPPRLLQEVHTRNLTAAENGTLAGVVVNLTPRVVVGTLSSDPLKLEDAHELASELSSAYPHSWSPDSGTLYFEQLQDGHWRIMSQSLLSNSPASRVNSKLDQVAPRLTPDHEWLLFAGRVPGTKPYQIFRVSPKGGVPQLVSTDGPASDFRCPLRAGTCLLSRIDDMKRLFFLPIDPVRGVGRPVMTLPWQATYNLGDWDISPDGRQLVVTSPQKSDLSLTVIDLRSGRMRKVLLETHRPIEAVNWDAAGKGWFLSVPNGIASDLMYATPVGGLTLLRQTAGSSYAIPW